MCLSEFSIKVGSHHQLKWACESKVKLVMPCYEKKKTNKQLIFWFHGNESLIIVNRMCHLKSQEVYQKLKHTGSVFT